jgi:hypothetical protein
MHFCAPCIRLGSIIVSLILPHAANGGFKAMIWCDPVPGFGRLGAPCLITLGGRPGRG